MKVLVIASVVFLFVYIGAQPYVKSLSVNLAVALNYFCDILVIVNLVVIFLYYSKYGKVESFLKDIDKQLEVKDFSFDVRALKNNNYFYIVNVENLDKNDILAYLDEMIYDLTSNCFKRKGTGVLCFITDKVNEDALEISKMITPLGRKGQLKIALAIDEVETGNVYFQGHDETKAKTMIANFVMNCEMPLKDKFIHKEKLPYQIELEKKAEKFTLKDFNNGNFYIH